ncbi:MAG: hypothetical protein J5589_08885 [Firmicutes bacterium]|nr:hypothetical protein [Bacillota bacterium]
MKFRAKTKDDLLYIKVKTPRKDDLNSAEMYYFASRSIPSFLCPVQEKKNTVIYSGPKGIPLKDYLERGVTHNEFFSLIRQITGATLRLRKEMFAINRVIWDIRYVYISERTKEIRLIFVPVEQKKDPKEILVFFVHMMNTLRLSSGKDREYLEDFYRFLKTQQSYEPVRIDRYISQYG